MVRLLSIPLKEELFLALEQGLCFRHPRCVRRSRCVGCLAYRLSASAATLRSTTSGLAPVDRQSSILRGLSIVAIRGTIRRGGFKAERDLTRKELWAYPDA